MQFTKSKKVAAALGAGAIVVAGSGVALAYFTSTGSGTASGTVAGAQTLTWDVTFGTPTYSAGSALYPGTTETFPVTITNSGNGHQGFSTLAAELKTVGTGPTATVADSNGDAITGCLASWFSVDVTSPASVVDLAPNAADSSQSATLSFINDPAVDQGDCQTKAPAFTVSAS